MAAANDIADWARELFASLGTIQAKPMFGGHGFYCDGVMFALEAEGNLYLKADPASEPTFRQAGGEPFRYTDKNGRTATMSYWSPPGEALDSPALMADWARLALGAALRARAKPGAGRSRAKAKSISAD